MTPIKAIRLSIGTLLAADTAFLAAAAAMKVALVIVNFVPSETLVLADLTLATFDGSTALSGAAGTQLTGLDPDTGDQIITVKEPAGGWRWATTGVTNLPQTVFGFALMDNAGAVLLASGLINTPLTLTIVGQEINLGTVKMTVVLEPLV